MCIRDSGWTDYTELDCNSDPLLASSLPEDLDGDKICNLLDTDDDGDQLSDSMEEIIGTDPLDADTDDDSYSDSIDDLPLNSDEWKDSDGDGIGDDSETILTNMDSLVPIIIPAVLISGVITMISMRYFNNKKNGDIENKRINLDDEEDLLDFDEEEDLLDFDEL